MRDPEVGFLARPTRIAPIVALLLAVTACQRASVHNAVATPSPSPRPWTSDETPLDAEGRAIIAKVRAKLPAQSRGCVVWTRVTKGTPDFNELPDHGLIVMFHIRNEEQGNGRPGYSVLYFSGAVHIVTNLVHIPNWDTDLLATPMDFDFHQVLPNSVYPQCLE